MTCKSTHLAPLALAALLTARAQAQQAQDPTILLTAALHRLDASNSDSHRFTFFENLRMSDVGRSGRLVHNTTRRYEVTYINDHQYMRLLEVDDKPLEGKDLEAEQKRYDKAIAKKKDLDSDKRSSSDDYVIEKRDFNIANLLTPEYTLKELPSTDPKLHLLEADQIPGFKKRKEKCQWHVRLWITATDPKDPLLTRYLANTLDDKSDLCRNLAEERRYTLVDNLPKLAIEADRLNVQDDGRYHLVESTTAYTNYRRFGTTITISPADAPPSQPIDAKPADPTPPGPPTPVAPQP
jgi:hypothetical protein